MRVTTYAVSPVNSSEVGRSRPADDGRRSCRPGRPAEAPVSGAAGLPSFSASAAGPRRPARGRTARPRPNSTSTIRRRAGSDLRARATGRERHDLAVSGRCGIGPASADEERAGRRTARPGRDDVAEREELADRAVGRHPKHAVVVPVGDQEPAPVRLASRTGRRSGRRSRSPADARSTTRRCRRSTVPAAVRPDPVDPGDDVAGRIGADQRDQHVGGAADERDVHRAADAARGSPREPLANVVVAPLADRPAAPGRPCRRSRRGRRPGRSCSRAAAARAARGRERGQLLDHRRVRISLRDRRGGSGGTRRSGHHRQRARCMLVLMHSSSCRGRRRRGPFAPRPGLTSAMGMNGIAFTASRPDVRHMHRAFVGRAAERAHPEALLASRSRNWDAAGPVATAVARHRAPSGRRPCRRRRRSPLPAGSRGRDRSGSARTSRSGWIASGLLGSLPPAPPEPPLAPPSPHPLPSAPSSPVATLPGRGLRVV